MISPLISISAKGRALLARYIQQNQPHAQFWLVLTLTCELRLTGATGTLPRRTSPLKIQKSYGAHLLYALNAVRTAPDASVKALKYAAAVERSLREKLCADRMAAPDLQKIRSTLEWLVMEWREEAYTLDELLIV
ncbi:replication initiation protein (plasmid) [Escherichia coli]